MRSIPSCQNFFEFLQKFQGMIVLVMHSQADPDTVGAAIGLTHLIQVINPNLEIRTLKPTLSALGHSLLEFANFHLDPIESSHIISPALCVLLDTNFIDPQLVTPRRQFAVIDHHIRTQLEVEVAFDYQFSSFRATTEIIASWYYNEDISLTQQVIKGLLAGIIFDTRRFLHADEELFKCVNFLLSNNSNVYIETMNLFSSSRTQSEKLACIKAAQRMKRFHINSKILLLSYVSSFEAAAARSLISLGGDIAIVIANRKQETRISFRTTLALPKETGISLGRDIIPDLINQFGGTGGGHDSAAGYNAPLLEIKAVKEFLFQLFEKILSRKDLKNS
ncbi:MAG: DHH family phosphoesterase [Candidatus Heimdallarchaeota archaeon]|nr:MAG: DHH family phosphoesterase [Candidatus Heimdallarchaeota archaeon]